MMQGKKRELQANLLMKIDVKILNKILANQYQKYHSPYSSQLHPKDAGVVQHMQIYKCNTTH
jgi:hypothetical protein